MYSNVEGDWDGSLEGGKGGVFVNGERGWERSRGKAGCIRREHFVRSKCWLLSQMFSVKLALHTFKQEPAHSRSNRYEVLHTTLKQKSKGLTLGVKGAQRIVSQGSKQSEHALACGNLRTLHQTCHCLSSADFFLFDDLYLTNSNQTCHRFQFS